MKPVLLAVGFFLGMLGETLCSEVPAHASFRACSSDDSTTYTPSPSTGRIRALVVGINNYRNEIPKLGGAVNDANLIANALRSIEIDTLLITDERATKNNIISQIERLITEAQSGDTVLFTFSGHGVKGKNLQENEVIIVTYDTPKDFMKDNSDNGFISSRDMSILIKKSKNKMVNFMIVSDAGSSGTFHGFCDIPDNLYYFGANSDEQSSPDIMIGGNQYGALSVAFAKALRGLTDQNADGWLSHAELVAFLSKEIPALTAKSHSFAPPSTPSFAAAPRVANEPLIRIAPPFNVRPATAPTVSVQPTALPLPPPVPVVSSFPGPRHALVIGAKSYRNIKPLERTLTDARALAEALKKRGFAVTLVEEPDRRALALAGPAFAEELRRSPGALAFVLFAGHGVEVKGANYLLPTDFPDVRDLPPGQGEALVRSDALALDTLLTEVKAAQPRYLVALFDACRDNPLVANGSRSVGGTRGLARIGAESNTAVMFTAGAGERALDRLPGNDPSPNGLFMRHFLTQMDNRDWPLDRIFRETAKRVVQDAGDKANHSQHPTHHSQIYDDIVLAAPPSR